MSAMNKTIPTFAEAADAKPKRDGIPELYYYPDAERLRTPIRDEGINLIYRTAREIDDGRLKYGDVSLRRPVFEDDCEGLVLTIVVDTNDRDAISAWDLAIIDRIIEWEAGLPDEQRKDFNRRVDFMYLPAKYDHAPA